jgi:ribosomal protein S15P/S13E
MNTTTTTSDGGTTNMAQEQPKVSRALLTRTVNGLARHIKALRHDGDYDAAYLLVQRMENAHNARRGRA